jgi:hypothetical protein
LFHRRWKPGVQSRKAIVQPSDLESDQLLEWRLNHAALMRRVIKREVPFEHIRAMAHRTQHGCVPTRSLNCLGLVASGWGKLIIPEQSYATHDLSFIPA